MTDDRTDRTVWRVRAVAVCAALVALAFFQSPDLLVDDGTLGLALDPAGAVRSWWRTGTLAPEAPAAPLFLLAWLLGLPAWSAQRLWWAALLCLAFAGLVTLARRWGIGTGASRLVAGTAYALSPGVLVALGGSSIDALPIAAVPWLVLGLIRAGRGWRGAVYAGLAAATAVWWSWAHGPAARGATVADAVTVLRGMADPTPWLTASDGPRPGSWRLTTQTPLVAATVTVAALGLAGLARRGMPHRGLLATSACAGLALVGLGHTGLLWPVSDGVLPGGVLPGGGGHRFDVVLRLPLMLGLAHLLGLWTRAIAAHKGLRRAPALVVLAVSAAVAATAVAAVPALARDLAPRNGFPAVPGYWHEAASWLAEHAGTARVLVAPAAYSPEYVWGSGDVVSLVATDAWVGDDTAGEPWRRTLDTALSSGAGDPWLADHLAASGVRYLLVRNDLAYARAGAPRPVLVAQALDRSPGLRLVAEFGPDLGASDSFVDGGLAVPLPALRVYRVDAEPPEPAPVVTDARATVTYRGIRGVSASSWWPLPGATGEAGFVPFAAVDGDPATSWRPAPDVAPEHQWVEVSLERAQVVSHLSVAFDPHAGALPTWLAVTAGGRQTLVETRGERVEIELPGTPTRTVRLTVLETVGTGGTVGIAEIAIPGVTAQRSLQLPEPTGAVAPTILLRATPSTPGCLFVDEVPRCSSAIPAPDGTTIDRVVRLPAAATYTAALWAQPRPGSALDALLDRVLAGPATPAVTASSTRHFEPAARPGAVLDGDPATAWWPSTGLNTVATLLLAGATPAHRPSDRTRQRRGRHPPHRGDRGRRRRPARRHPARRCAAVRPATVDSQPERVPARRARGRGLRPVPEPVRSGAGRDRRHHLPARHAGSAAQPCHTRAVGVRQWPDADRRWSPRAEPARGHARRPRGAAGGTGGRLRRTDGHAGRGRAPHRRDRQRRGGADPRAAGTGWRTDRPGTPGAGGCGAHG